MILFTLFASVIFISASAQLQYAGDPFYLHAGDILDENSLTSATPAALDLGGAVQYFVWKTAVFPTAESFPAGTWNANLWMNITTGPTQYTVALGVVRQSAVRVWLFHTFTPIIESPSAATCQVAISAGILSVGVGESLAIGLLRQQENGAYSSPAFIFFDSPTAPSSLISPSTTTTTSQTTTQHLITLTTQTTATITEVRSGPGIGVAFAVIAIGAGIACGMGGAAVAVIGGPYSEVFQYSGYYYCKKHRVPVWYVQGSLWCPVEQRYLRP